MLDILGALWGPLGTNLSAGIFGLPLGPPAEIEVSLATIKAQQAQVIPLNQVIDFGAAHLIPGNEPGYGDQFPVRADHNLFNPAEQQAAVRRWLAELCVNNGYQNVEEEIARHDADTVAGTDDSEGS